MPTNRDIQVVLKLKDSMSKKHKTAMQKMRQVGRNTLTFLRKHWLKLAAAIAAVTYAVIRGMKSAISYVVELDKMAKQADITTRQFARLAYAAEQEHTSMDTLTKVFPILTKYMEYARQGQEMYLREFRKMGIDVADGTGKLKTTNEVFLEMADYYSTAKDKTKALAIAVTLLGRRGAELVPLLKLGRGGLEELGDEAERLGLVVDDQTAAAFKRFDDQLTKIKMAFKGVWIKVATKLMADMTAMAEKFDEVDWDTIAQQIADILRGAAGLAKLLYDTSQWFAGFSGPQTELGYLNKELEETNKKLKIAEKIFLEDKFRAYTGGARKEVEKLRFQVEILEKAIKAATPSKDIQLGPAIIPEEPGGVPLEEPLGFSEMSQREKFAYDLNLKLMNLRGEDREAQLVMLTQQVGDWQAVYGSDGELAKMISDFYQLKRDKIMAAEEGLGKWQKIANERTYNAMSDSFKTIFVDTLQGQLRTARDYFQSFRTAVINMIADIVAQWATLKLLGKSPGGSGGTGGGLLASLFSGGGGGAAAGGGFLASLFSFFHQGGLVYAHNGLAVDEVPVIAQTGEGFLSRRGMANLGGSGELNRLNRGQEARDAQPVIHNHYNIQTFDAGSFKDYLEENKGIVGNAMMSAMDDNHPSRRGM